jgi:hypothetical protein
VFRVPSPIAKEALYRVGQLYDQGLAAPTIGDETTAAVTADRRVTSCLDQRDGAKAVAQTRARRRLPLHAGPLAGARPLLRGRPFGRRLQLGRTGAAWRCHRPEELSLDAIFAVEREINGFATTDRHTARQNRIAPLVGDLADWMRTQRGRLSRHAETAKAIDYMLKRWTAFTRFLGDGRICLTNNAAERALRGIALGRKAWLFAGSDRGGERAAAIYTLIGTAKLNATSTRSKRSLITVEEALDGIRPRSGSRPRAAVGQGGCWASY